MRLRLQTSTTASSHFPQLKAWFSFAANGDNSEQKTVIDLKKSICSSIKVFANANLTFRDFDLELDGFELLDELVALEVLREGDLLVAKRREAYNGLKKKRKAEDEGSETKPEKRPKYSKTKVKAPLVSSEPSLSSSSSSDSEISTTSESDSSTGSDSSDSDSDSDSSSSESPSVIPLHSLPSKSAPPQPKMKHPAEQKHVPPGLGSVQTRKRNVRRRIKKKYDAAVAKGSVVIEPLTPKRMSGANVAPLGVRPNISTNPSSLNASEVDPINDALNLTMFSLGNKNKKKGFKYAIAPPTTQKKVFSTSVERVEEAESISPEVLDGPLPPSTSIFTSASIAEERRQHQPRLITPSELQSLGNLPKNMFVTSVDVEEGLWDSPKKKKQRKQQLRTDEYDYSDSYGNRGELVDSEEAMVLDYGVAEGPSGSVASAVQIPTSGGDQEAGHDEDSKSTLIWSVVENNFDALREVSTASLQNGQVVAWKALALNPKTFSPEILLHVATVTAISGPSDEQLDTVSIRRLIRPNWEDLDVEDVEASYTLESIKGMGWKAVDEIRRP